MLQQYVLISYHPRTTVTPGGITLTVHETVGPRKADVLAFGPEAEGVEVGDVVWVQNTMGTQLKELGEEVYSTTIQSIMGVVE